MPIRRKADEQKGWCTMKIIVDAFGGDNAPLEIVKGSAMAVAEYGVDIVLTGDESVMRKISRGQRDFAASYGNCPCIAGDGHESQSQPKF